MHSFWNTTLTPSDAPVVLEAGEIRMGLKVEEGDWLLAIVRDEADREPLVQTGSDLGDEEPEWRRIGSVEELPKIRVTPAYPDRALVVRPKVAYALLPNERVQFYVSVPLWIRLASPTDFTLFQVPVATLSNTWFGLPTAGELAYAIRTRARRSVEELEFHPLRAVCPVRVKNQSKETVTFERICIRPQFLSLFEDEKLGLWANESSMIFRTDQEANRVAYARNPPANLKRPHRWIKGTDEATGTHLLRAISGSKGFFNE